MARILIADDQSSMREMMSLACQLDGHEVIEAIDATTAIDLYEREDPDLMLLDLNMPGGGGQHVIKQLRFAHAGQLKPFIIVSGYIGDMASGELQALRAHRVIEKPFTLDTLRGAIMEAVSASA